MVAELLRRLIGRSQPVPAEVREAVDELTRLAEERLELASPAGVLRDILTVLYAEPLPPATTTLTSEQVRTKLDHGVPILRGESVSLDVAAFERRWLGLCTVMLPPHPHPPPPGGREKKAPSPLAGEGSIFLPPPSAGEGGGGGDARTLAEALRRRTLDPRQLTDAALAGRPDLIHAQADQLGLDAALTAAILRLTLFPVLSQINTTLTAFRTGRWEHGYCPTCGSWPLLGEFRGLEQTRFLRCGLCAAAWEFPRLRCPFCGTADHHQLGYFHVEAEEAKYRAATCAVCGRYVKMLSSLGELSPPRLLVADLATLHLDLVAADRGCC